MSERTIGILNGEQFHPGLEEQIKKKLMTPRNRASVKKEIHEYDFKKGNIFKIKYALI